MTEKLTHHKKLSNPLYIGAYSLNPCEERVITIKKVFVDEVFDPSSGKKKECVIAELINEKPMILNATNRKMIEKLHKSPYIEHWVGKQVIIYIDQILDKRTKEMVDCLRIKNKLPNNAIKQNNVESKAFDEVKKPSLTDERFSNALKSIGSGEFTKQQLIDKFELTEGQKTNLDEYVNQLTGASIDSLSEVR